MEKNRKKHIIYHSALAVYLGTTNHSNSCFVNEMFREINKLSTAYQMDGARVPFLESLKPIVEQNISFSRVLSENLQL